MSCPLCARIPNAHSFSQFGFTTDGIPLYYTAPAKATARDTAQSFVTLKHHLKEIQGPWIWVLDCTGMQIQHQHTMQLAVAFADLIVKEYNMLRRVVVIHPNPWIYRVVHALSPEFQECIQYANRPIELIRATANFTSEAKTWLQLAIKS